MKLEQITPKEPEFKPITIQITFESRDEIENFWAVQNHSAIVRFQGFNLNHAFHASFRNNEKWEAMQKLISNDWAVVIDDLQR